MRTIRCPFRPAAALAVVAATLVLGGCVNLKLDNTATLPGARTQSSLYQVRPGETLEQVAARHNVLPAELAAHNRLTQPGRLQAGTTLRIPPRVMAGPPPVTDDSWLKFPGALGTGYAAAAKVIGKRGDKTRTVASAPSWFDSLSHEACPRQPQPEYQVCARVEDVSARGYCWPTIGKVSRGFNPSTNHRGIDICAPVGTPVRAARAGMVIYTGDKFSGYGNVVIIDHGSDVATVYGHNQRNLVRMGQRVNRGDVIAVVGQTGNATTPHVHFEVRHASQPIDPRPLLP